VDAGAFRAAIARHRLAADGWGRKRRFPRQTVQALLDRRPHGASVQTSNYYLSHLKSFCRWLKGKLPRNPVEDVEPGNAAVDRRHDRRELTADELRKVLDAARQSEATFRGLTGDDRFHLYATACATGFRASALASLTPERFDLDPHGPVVTCAARDAKNRKTKVQPLPPDVADLLRAYLKGRPSRRPIWGGTWARDHRGSEMLRLDLAAAGVPYVVEGPDGPLFADFHALRHTYLTLGGRAGIDLRTLQELAGHSKPELTTRYSHRRVYDLATAVEKLPNFLPAGQERPAPEALAATGTDGTAPEKLGGQLGDASSASGHILSFPVATGGAESGEGESKNPLVSKGFVASGRDKALSVTSEGDGTRTRNHRIDSPVL
jgi:integrase